MHDTKPTQDELEAGMCQECAGHGCYECSETGEAGIGRHLHHYSDHDEGSEWS